MSPAQVRQVLGYARVSTEEQTASGLGLTAQLDAIKAEAARRGWELLGIYQDTGSGKDTARPRLQAALAALGRKEAQGLLVAKLDRLSRSVRDFGDLAYRSQREGWAIVALDVAVDTTTPAGEAMANMMVTFAQFERRLIGQRTKDALAVRKAQGARLGRPVQLPVRVEREIVRLRGREGLSMARIAQALNEQGVPTCGGGLRWRSSTIARVLERHPELATA